MFLNFFLGVYDWKNYCIVYLYTQRVKSIVFAVSIKFCNESITAICSKSIDLKQGDRWLVVAGNYIHAFVASSPGCIETNNMTASMRGGKQLHMYVLYNFNIIIHIDIHWQVIEFFLKFKRNILSIFTDFVRR